MIISITGATSMGEKQRKGVQVTPHPSTQTNVCSLLLHNLSTKTKNKIFFSRH